MLGVSTSRRAPRNLGPCMTRTQARLTIPASEHRRFPISRARNVPPLGRRAKTETCGRSVAPGAGGGGAVSNASPSCRPAELLPDPVERGAFQSSQLLFPAPGPAVHAPGAESPNSSWAASMRVQLFAKVLAARGAGVDQVSLERSTWL